MMNKTVKELRVMAKDNGIKGYSRMTKSELINAIESVKAPVVEVIVEKAPVVEVIDLNKATMSELAKICKSNGVAFRLGSKKVDIVAAIEAKRNETKAPVSEKANLATLASSLSRQATVGSLEIDKKVEKELRSSVDSKRKELQKKISNHYKANGHKMYVRNEAGSVVFRLDNAIKEGVKVVFTATNPFKMVSKITLDALLDGKFIVITSAKAKVLADRMVALSNHFSKVSKARKTNKPVTYTVDIKGEDVYVTDRIRNKTEKANTTSRTKAVIKKAKYVDSKGDIASIEYAYSSISANRLKELLSMGSN